MRKSVIKNVKKQITKENRQTTFSFEKHVTLSHYRYQSSLVTMISILLKLCYHVFLWTVNHAYAIL
jgi:hypothetical protein